MTTTVTLKAPAKINLTLEVLGKRPDGYHEVRMLMVGVSLEDELRFSEAKALTLTCDREDLDCSGSNLILKAAIALQKATKTALGAKIHLKKRIPLGGGLAGGSTDAAATLIGLNQLWNTGLTLKRLSAIGATLGSDIPFCIESGWAIATGRGEKLKKMVPPEPMHFVLANPGFEVSTKWAYGGVILSDAPRRNLSLAAYDAASSGDVLALDKAAQNDLEKVTAARYKEIGILKKEMVEQGAFVTRMSGSGPTVWGWFKTASAAKKAAANFKKRGILALAVHSISENKDKG
jgi:4-diphosphocytidyl-2-C-methyl-D-erythritol kinase